MNDHPDLANRIGQMREAGLSIDEVISTLGISWEMSVAERLIRQPPSSGKYSFSRMAME